MKAARTVAATVVATLSLSLASLALPASSSGGSPGSEPPAETSSHCDGFVSTQSNLDTETVTSIWVFNTSLFNPPVCQQRAVAICSEFDYVFGNFTTAMGEQSTATCHPGESLILGGSEIRHVPSAPS